ncbi:MAG: anti-sigma factor family protein, partial [Eubacteriales bacterium]
MLCERSDKIINDYLDGDLAPAKMSQFELHLAECGACRREFEKLKTADDFLRRGVRQLVEEIPVPDSLLEGLEKRLAREKKGLIKLRRIPLVTRYAGIAAAFLILVAAAALLRANFGPLGRIDGWPAAKSTSPATEIGGGSPDEGQIPTGAANEKQVADGSQKNLMEYDRATGPRTSTVQPPVAVAGNTGEGENLHKKGSS